MKPLAIDLCCGLGGWTEGFDVVGFDIERHEYGEHRYPAQLVLQDITTLHGAQFRNAALIVASPPCQAYSYRAMPWSRAKALPPPDNTLFQTCFRIQHEAIKAAGRHIPLIVENVCGAQPWVGRARWNYGSFYLWGDVPALMPFTKKRMKSLLIAAHIRDGRTDYSRPTDGIKGVPHRTAGHWTNPAEHEGIKQQPNTTFEARRRPGMSNNSGGNFWFQEGASRHGSGSSARKRASALIAKIPLPLAQHIARTYRP